MPTNIPQPHAIIDSYHKAKLVLALHIPGRTHKYGNGWHNSPSPEHPYPPTIHQLYREHDDGINQWTIDSRHVEFAQRIVISKVVDIPEEYVVHCHQRLRGIEHEEKMYYGRASEFFWRWLVDLHEPTARSHFLSFLALYRYMT